MRRSIARRVFEGLVGDVTDCLGHGAEGGRRLDPAHGACEGDADELWFSCVLRQDETQPEAVQSFEEQAVEAVLDVGLGGSDGPVSGICMPDDGEETVQSPAELHSFRGCMRRGGLVYGGPTPVPTVVAQEAWFPFAFFLHCGW